ncbi:serine 3-dehydrogenase [Talaromyces proteolyticus]|uniref:Serine 3-dehydrogenase n=1 Tax=Talaromyces proteolyticus TaxID=1131652 RepID=A0AAD4KL76_9EURO|nr:serine 3-dehydrogenase [Talaromyces proteolyticus]KAH8695298.1 serine 3-dehydrogenase [Talaromyces proteolyticus]
MARTWFITGCSSGFGEAIAKAARALGDNVVATSREAAKLGDLAQIGAYTVSLDVNSPQKDIDALVAEAVNKYGSIDILVNNAGYILEGGVEEVSDEEVRAQFDTNVFGQLAVTRAVLPYMRAKKSGVIANMGSIAGWRGGINCGMYCSAKFALIGITEALRKEVEPLGITVVAIEPGYFRTNFLSGGHKVSPKKTIDDLVPVIKPVKDMFAMYNHQQPGDPLKGAQLIVEALTGTGRCADKRLPARLAIGTDAVAMISEVLEDKKKELDDWKDLAITTDLAA